MDMPAILEKISTPLQFAALALLVFIYGLMKLRSNRKFVWLTVFSGIAMVGGLGLALLDKPPLPPSTMNVINTGQGGAAVGTINVGGGNGK